MLSKLEVAEEVVDNETTLYIQTVSRLHSHSHSHSHSDVHFYIIGFVKTALTSTYANKH